MISIKIAFKIPVLVVKFQQKYVLNGTISKVNYF